MCNRDTVACYCVPVAHILFALINDDNMCKQNKHVNNVLLYNTNINSIYYL